MAGGKVWALLAGDLPEAQREDDRRHFRLFHDLELRVVIRDGEEVLMLRRRCGALVDMPMPTLARTE